MKHFCVIEPNDLHYSDLDNNIQRFNKYKLEEDLEDNISFQKFDLDFMDKVLSIISPALNTVLYTTNVYETEQYVYQLIHMIKFMGMDEQTYNKDLIARGKNNIANILVDNQYSVYGNAVLTKYKINDDGTLISIDFNINDFISIFRKKKVITGVLIKPSNELFDVEYIGSPLSWINPQNSHNYRFYEIEIFGKILMFFIEISPNNKSLNTIASNIYDKGNPIYGDVFIAMKIKNNDIAIPNDIYCNLTSNNISKLNDITMYNYDRTIEPTFYNHSTQKYENIYNLIETIYYNKLTKTNRKIIDTTVKSLNEITHVIIQNTKK